MVRVLRSVPSLLQAHIIFVTRGNLEGFRFRKPVFGNLSVDFTEPEFLIFLRRLLPHIDGLFLDVGANVGQTLIKVKSIAPDMPYLGIEPDPSAMTYLTKLTSANQWPNTVLLAAAASERSQLVPLRETSGSAGNQILIKRGADALAEEFICSALTVDGIVSEFDIERVSVLKVDVEGHELEVLKGSASLIKRDRPVLILEILPPRPQNSLEVNLKREHRASALGDFLNENNYSCQHLESDGALSPPFDLRLGIQSITKTREESLNYVCRSATAVG